MKNSDDRTSRAIPIALLILLILVVLAVLILAVCYVGFPGAHETPSNASCDSIATLPSTQQTTDQIRTTDTIDPVGTESTTDERQSTTATETVPTYPPVTTTTTTVTTPPRTTTAPISTETTAPPPAYDVSDKAMQALIEERFLTIDPGSRSGNKLTSLKNIVVHYTGNPGSTAERNWLNFENNRPNTSAHFIIGLDGEIIQCMPLDEVAWAIGTDEGNYTSISIECCHPDKTGKFTDATYDSLVRLVSWLCNKFGLGRDAVIRHYDYPRYTSTGLEWHKECPLYYAKASDPDSHKRWEAFKDDLVLTAEPPKQPENDEDKIESLIIKRYLTVHENSRPGYKLKSLNNIVVHYTGNPGTTADQNWRNFENNKPSASAHFIIGLDGEILQCMPLDEVAWAVGTTEGNYTSISIECCHPDSTGKFTDATYESLVKLVSWLCNQFGLDRDKVIRHYDYPRYTASGMEWHKQCPLYYANANDPASHKRWEAFKNDLTID